MLAELRFALGVVGSAHGANPRILGLSTDSRRVRSGDLFFAVPGLRCDGASFIAEAVARGACGVVRDAAAPVPELPRGIVDLPVRDVRGAKTAAAHAFYGDPSASLRCVGVTGTNGKTTTASLLQAILSAADLAPTQIGTTGMRHADGELTPLPNTTPDPIDLIAALADTRDRGGRAVVMEVSSHALEQERVAGIRFDVGVFTQLSREHLDYHRTVERYCAAKARLFEMLGEDAVAVLNAEDAHSLDLVKRSRSSVLSYGMVPGAHLRLLQWESGISCSRLEVEYGAERFAWVTRLAGRHNVMNVLAAAGAALASGISPEVIAAGIESVHTVPGRLEALPTGRGFRVLIDYAHTDDALEKVLRALKPLTKQRIITVFGCGGDRDRDKRPRMGRVASIWSDLLIVTSDNPRSESPEVIAHEVMEGVSAGADAEVVLDRRAAIARALEQAREGDIVLVAGKGHEATQDVGGVTSPFDDRLVTEELLCRSCD